MAPVHSRVTRSTAKEMATKSIDPNPVPASELPPVDGDPPAWAEIRPPLCDSLEWFRAVQGSLYHNDKTAYGLLLEKDGAGRVHIDDEIIITRIGGNGEIDEEGNWRLKKDQKMEDVNPTSLNNAKTNKVPIGVIISDRAEGLQRKLPHRYNVMGWFRVTDIWYEGVTGKKGLKVRLEKMDLTEKSWWSVKGSPNPPPLDQRDFVTKPESHKCTKCSRTSFRVYEEGWMCLNPKCGRFWTINGAAPTNFTFHSTFLSYRTRPDPEMVPQSDLVPDFSTTLNDVYSAGSTARDAWRGIVCPQCSQCVAREYWEGWKCTHCNFEHMMNMPVLTLDQAGQPNPKRRTRPIPSFMSPQFDDHSAAPYRKRIYTLPGVGWITHFVANDAINSQPGGPDEMFRNLQATRLGLKRYPLSAAVVKGTKTAHFAVNYGMPYKYVVSVDSKGFDEAPDDVLRALGRLSWATEKAVTSAGGVYQAPNELLILGYFAEMSVGFHDDGEESLGPTIATLSLGSNSNMRIRMKSKHWQGHSGLGSGSKAKEYRLLRDDPVLQNCRHEDERRELKRQYDAREITQAQYDEARTQIFQTDKKLGKPPVLIDMHLKHGDLVVMHGGELQKYYEHAVAPDGLMRYALTARYIMADHVPEKEHKKGRFSLTSEQEYHGD